MALGKTPIKNVVKKQNSTQKRPRLRPFLLSIFKFLLYARQNPRIAPPLFGQIAPM